MGVSSILYCVFLSAGRIYLRLQASSDPQLTAVEATQMHKYTPQRPATARSDRPVHRKKLYSDHIIDAADKVFNDNLELRLPLTMYGFLPFLTASFSQFYYISFLLFS